MRLKESGKWDILWVLDQILILRFSEIFFAYLKKAQPTLKSRHLMPALFPEPSLMDC